MEALLNDPIIKFFGGLLALIVTAGTAILGWRKEKKLYEDTKESAKASVPAIMQGLAAVGTPMQALTGDSLDAINDLIRAMELLRAAIESNRTSVESNRAMLELMHREAKDAEIRQQAFREGQETARRERDRRG